MAEQDGAGLQQLGFNQAGDDVSVDQIKRPHEAPPQPADDLAAGYRILSIMPRDHRGFLFHQAPKVIVGDPVLAIGQPIADRAEAIQRDVADNNARPRRHETLEELAVGLMNYRP